MQRFKITKEGHSKLKADLDRLINVERVKISNAIGEAIELGDLSENTEYSSSKERQLINEALIATLGEKISNADVVDMDKLSGNSIDFGATVSLMDEDSERKISYTLLSEFEADPLKHVISLNSPIGNALFGKCIGESVEIRAPGGTKYYRITDIKWGNSTYNVL
ncbi:MAG: transcription elongation factor GreA [Rickettsiales bacterium]|nr:transcription elongation factor GreA [Rickettsiales bacterium]